MFLHVFHDFLGVGVTGVASEKWVNTSVKWPKLQKKDFPFLTIWNRYVVYYVLSRFYDNDIEYETFLNTYFSVNQFKNEE